MAAQIVRMLGGRMQDRDDARLTEALTDIDRLRGQANTLTVQLRTLEQELADTRQELATADTEIHRLTDALSAFPPATGELEPALIGDALSAQPAYTQLRDEDGVPA